MYVIGSVVLAVLLIVLIKTGKLKLHKNFRGDCGYAYDSGISRAVFC